MREIERILGLSKDPIYEDYALSPLQLEKLVREHDYRVHLNLYDEKVFGPPVKIRSNKKKNGN